MDIFATRLTRERESRGWTKEHAANELGLKYSTLVHYEAGKRRPDYETVVKIAQHYGVTVDYLLGSSHVKQGDGPDLQSILDLSDEQILQNVKFSVDAQLLSEIQVRRLIAFVRAERSFVHDNGQ